MTRNFLKQFSFAAVAGALFLSGCAQSPTAEFYDPLEKMNRKTHALNKKLDRAILSPAGTAYGILLTDADGIVVDNLVDNLGVPNRAANQVLQFRFGQAAGSVLRFAINTTMGLGGTIDAASDFGLPNKETDFGETLHVWGFGEGAYLELPFLGGSNVRDTTGIIVDFIGDPLDKVIRTSHNKYKYTAQAIELAGDRHQFDDVIEGVLYSSEDSYASLRLYYLQNRRFALNGGEIAAEDLENPYDTLD